MSTNMDNIFYERSEPIKAIVRRYDEECDRVLTDDVQVSISTTAHYDDVLHVLVVDQEIEISPGWMKDYLLWSLPNRRTMETHKLRGPATRRAIALADEYAEQLSCTAFDDERSLDEVRGAYKAKYGTRIPF